MDIGFFKRILDIDSTTGKEREFAGFLADELAAPGRKVSLYEVGDGTLNLFVKWGTPKVVFCTHLDTVPPYIPPTIGETDIYGRGACDAKGQIFTMYEACRILEARGYSDFGLLLLAGEETGSFGAKAFSTRCQGAEWVIVGEPTDNCMASASKGTKAFELTFEGKAFHSGYPQYGSSAVEMFNDFMNAIRSVRFPYDETLGETTWNIGRLCSDNPQNILSDRLTCRIYFRTTFESDEMVSNLMKNMAGENAPLRFGRRMAQDGSDLLGKDVAQWQKSLSVNALGGDSPMHYQTLDGFPVKPVSFGSDAPQLTSFRKKILCGPGSILVAHRPDEHIRISDLEEAIRNYVSMYEILADMSAGIADY